MAYQKIVAYKPPGRGKGSKLSVLQSAFIDHYMVTKRGTEAIILAGSRTKNPARAATEMLNHPLVKAEIERRRDVLADKSIMTIEYLAQKLLDIIQREEEENPTAALRAIELAGKHLGMYRDRQEISGPDGAAIQMEQKTRENAEAFTAQLKKLAKKTDASEDSNVVDFKRA